MKKKLTGTEKAAVVLLAMSQENVSKIFSKLQEDEVKELTYAMANLGSVDSTTIDKIMEEFKKDVTSSLSLIGNIDTTEKLLLSAFDKEKVAQLLEDVKGPTGKNTWDKLTNVNEDLLIAYLKNEHPQTIALIITKISPQTAAKVLVALPDELTSEIMVRILNISSVKKEVLERIETTLRSDFISSLGKVQDRDSNVLLAEIFNNFDRQNEGKYMEILEKRNPEKAQRVKELMFTFDDIVKVHPNDIPNVLRNIDKSKLTLALKGASPEIRKLFIDSMSKRAAKILEEDIQSLGPVKLKDVDDAQSSIAKVLKDMIEREEITLLSGDNSDEYIE